MRSSRGNLLPWWRWAVLVGLVASAASAARAEETPAGQAAAVVRETVSGETAFRRTVAPLLAEKCGRCHGPDEAESGYRIDDRRHAFAGGDSGIAGVVPGEPEKSELFKRISLAAGNAGDDASRKDAEGRMPADGEPLSATEQAAIQAWILAGAAWPDDLASLASLIPAAGPKPLKGEGHWAFRPVVRAVLSAPPLSSGADGAAAADEGTGGVGAIDAFVAARLAAANLAMNPATDPRTLLRRVSFDLVGLPPTPEEIADFTAAVAADGIDRAYAAVVDRLLASPHHGERWARHWLDVVRFAESHGFEMNRHRDNAWPYRDWVIAAFNDDMPYDDFIRRQLCGDQLGADAATGFIVGGPMDQVKSPDAVLTANQRADELHDMVGTTGSAFLGLTVGCARCHDHKFDPIPQTDYYRLKGVFAGVEHGERPIIPPDNDARLARVAALKRELAEPARRLDALRPLASPRRSISIDETSPGAAMLLAASGTARHADGADSGHLGFKGDVRSLPDIGRGYTWWTGVAGTPVIAYAPAAEGLFRVWVSWGAGFDSHARDALYLLDADGDPRTADDQQTILTVDQRLCADGAGEPPPGVPLWSGFRDAGVHRIGPQTRLLLSGGATAAPVTADVVVFEEVDAAAAEAPASGIPHLRSRVTSRANLDRFAPVTVRFLRFTILATSDGEPCIDELTVLATDGREVSRQATPSASGTVEGNPAHRLEHVNDGRLGNARSWASNETDRGWVQLEFPAETEIDRVIWSRDRSDDPRFKDRVATRYRIDVSSNGCDWQRVATSDDRLPFTFDAAIPPITAVARLTPAEAAEASELSKTVADLEKQLAAVEKLPLVYGGRFVTPDRVHRLFRGDPMAPREVIAAGSLTRFGAAWELPADAPEKDRRRALADWIASPANPLTARVIVNRLWHHHFGTGIVDTPSDLGVNGGPPSHPELLDWLAAELVDPANPADRWRLKRIHRLIVTSRAYRQASTSRPDGLAADASARLLWRYPPRRLEAEPLRDAILAVSGSLNRKMGGPGFDLFEPNANYVKVYATRTTFTDEEFRRMIYQAKPRSELDTFFGAFDCPDAGQVQPKRTVSTTPLQALNMMNGEFLLDQAARFAARVEREVGGDPAAQVARAIELAFGRPATPRELEAGRDLVAGHGLPILCRSLYNASEFITVY
jgi:cytochrome c553